MKSRFVLAEKEENKKGKREEVRGRGKREKNKYEEQEKYCGQVKSVYLVGRQIDISV